MREFALRGMLAHSRRGAAAGTRFRISMFIKYVEYV